MGDIKTFSSHLPDREFVSAVLVLLDDFCLLGDVEPAQEIFMFRRLHFVKKTDLHCKVKLGYNEYVWD